MEQVATKEWPSVFTAQSVREILAGRKTQTRRVVTAHNSLVDGSPPVRAWWPLFDFSKAWVDPGPSPAGNRGPYLKVPMPREDTVHRIYPKYREEDHLWVRETAWYDREVVADVGELRVFYSDGRMKFQEGERDIWSVGGEVQAKAGHIEELMKAAGLVKRPSIHMNRWASRILLEVTEVRVERLQEITLRDIEDEGVYIPSASANEDAYRRAWRKGWNEINAKRGFGWDKDPWLWVVKFKVVEP